MRNGEDTYFGVLWSAISAYVDFLTPSAQQFWTEQFVRYQKMLPYDGKPKAEHCLSCDTFETIADSLYSSQAFGSMYPMRHPSAPTPFARIS